MGGWRWKRKRTVEECKSVHMSFLRKNGYLDCRWPQGIAWTNHFGKETASMTVITTLSKGESYIRFVYTIVYRNTGEERHFDYQVPLISTPCHFGGVRWWFVCPVTAEGGCGRKVGVLYRAPRADYYACRHCLNLSYESRNRSRRGRLGHMGYALALTRQMENLRKQTHRWTYGGTVTRKARQLCALSTRLDSYISAYLPDLQ